MAAFQKKQLTPSKRICLRLKEAREMRGVSLADLARKTKINPQYLQALEDCDFDALPKASVYHRKFVSAYVQALGLASEPFVQQLVDEELIDAPGAGHPSRHVDLSRFRNLPVLLRYASLAVLALSLIGYLGLQVKRILEPPSLVIYTPQSGLVADTSAITVQGKTDPEVTISINGERVVHNEDGQFQTAITLGNGINTIVISAQKKHGKTTTETRHVILRERGV